MDLIKPSSIHAIFKAMTLSRSFKSQKKKINNFSQNELKIAYNGKKSKIIKVYVRKFLTKMYILDGKLVFKGFFRKKSTSSDRK